MQALEASQYLPQVIYLLINVFGLGILFVSHGKEGKVNGIAPTLAWLLITLPLLWWGGFFG